MKGKTQETKKKNFLNINIEKIQWKKIIIALIFLLIMTAVTIQVRKVLIENAIKKQVAYEEWLYENCQCMEKERIKCPEGFELKGRICKAEGKWTNVLLACSKYNCTEEIKLWNNETEKWGIRLKWQNQN